MQTIAGSPTPGPVRWRQIADAADPSRIRALVASTGVFSEEEIDVAGQLVESTLAGTEVFRFQFAERAGHIIGYTCFAQVPLSAVSFDLYWIAVAPEAHGTGLAHQLIARTAAVIRRKNGLFVFAETSSRDPYGKARTFYRKAGFEEAARFPDFYDRGDDKIVYRLVL